MTYKEFLKYLAEKLVDEAIENSKEKKNDK